MTTTRSSTLEMEEHQPQRHLVSPHLGHPLLPISPLANLSALWRISTGAGPDQRLKPRKRKDSERLSCVNARVIESCLMPARTVWNLLLRDPPSRHSHHNRPDSCLVRMLPLPTGTLQVGRARSVNFPPILQAHHHQDGRYHRICLASRKDLPSPHNPPRHSSLHVQLGDRVAMPSDSYRLTWPTGLNSLHNHLHSTSVPRQRTCQVCHLANHSARLQLLPLLHRKRQALRHVHHLRPM